jgi:hypothetical protein
MAVGQGYVETHALDHPVNSAAHSHGAPEEFDGIAEPRWNGRANLAEVLSTAAGRAASQYGDERRFIDHARSPLCVC